MQELTNSFLSATSKNPNHDNTYLVTLVLIPQKKATTKQS
jgi:hypothetical protein